MSKIIINKENYFHNLELISKKANSKNNISVVLKDNAYGHGLIEIATLAKEFGITKAVVRNTNEAKIIKNLFKDILILGSGNKETYSLPFHITINSLEEIDQVPINTNIHLKIDTGMHRNGISINELEDAIYRIFKKKINLIGIFTHHRSADQIKTDFYYQSRVFRAIKKEVIRLCEQLKLTVPLFHSSNSSALFRTNNFTDSFARIGIAQYGYLENHKIFGDIDLRPVLSLWAKKTTTLSLKKGQRVGYGSEYELDKDTIVSSYDIGYADGFLRINENKTYTTPKGYQVLGRVSMDYISLNSNDEEVCIFDDAKHLAKLHNTIPYEIITLLNSNIERKIE